MNPVDFVEQVQQEFFEQVAYYEEREKGLGERFRQAVEAAAALTRYGCAAMRDYPDGVRAVAATLPAGKARCAISSP